MKNDEYEYVMINLNQTSQKTFFRTDETFVWPINGFLNGDLHII